MRKTKRRFVMAVAMASILALAGCRNSAGGDGGGTVTGKELKGTPTVGSIIMKDGSLKTASDITNDDKANAIAVVYKVEGGKAYAVGKVHEKNGKAWAIENAKGAKSKIENLCTNVSGGTGDLTFSGVYLDGSTGWTKLQNTSGVDDTGTAGNYPAWEWVNAYGTTNSLTGTMQNGWYFPSIAELYDICKNESAVDASLEAIDGDKFGTNKYWSSSQATASSSGPVHAFYLIYGGGGECKDSTKSDTSRNLFVCAVRAFTY